MIHQQVKRPDLISQSNPTFIVYSSTFLKAVLSIFLPGEVFWGKRHFYAGGGYVAYLGNTKDEALQLVSDLIDTNWVERHSRALMVEFNVFNANTNLFSYVLVGVEMNMEGSFTHTIRIGTLVLYR